MDDLIDRVREQAHPLRGAQDMDAVLKRMASATYVLIGEASHGTADFYRWRAELTKRLIAEHGFSFVAVEGDWPDCHRLHCCVVGAPGVPKDPAAVLWDFGRWPRWMWANEEVVEFATWLREFNAWTDHPVGFHGLDVYSLWDSLREVLAYLREHEPDLVDVALDAYRCFEPHREDPVSYAFASRMLPAGCEEEVVALLAQRRQVVADRTEPTLSPSFVATQNAEVIAGAERYYRTLVRSDQSSWNVRDVHMVDTLGHLMGQYGSKARAVIWAHNTHVGDARATDMADAGMVNVGQLVRQRHAADGVVIVGMGTYGGSVIASDFWGGPVQWMPVPDARAGSFEALLHDAVPGRDSFWCFDRDDDWAGQARGHRAIGVVYHPDAERSGNYVPTVLNRRYDAFVHCDRSTAVNPLHHSEYASCETVPARTPITQR